VCQRNPQARPNGFKNLYPSKKPETVTRQLTKPVEFYQNFLCDFQPPGLTLFRFGPWVRILGREVEVGKSSAPNSSAEPPPSACKTRHIM
jgi:hypothetical protein